MTESNDTTSDSNDELGGVLGEVGLEYEDDDDDKIEDEASEGIDEEDEDQKTDGAAAEGEDSGADTEGDTSMDAGSAESSADDGPFAPEPGMQLTKSLGTKLTPPEKEFIELYVEFSDEYEHTGEFLRVFVDELRQEYGEEVMRRKKALEELKGGL